jgi:hypothetical protein
MKDTNDYWINEFMKLYFNGYKIDTIKKIIHERRKQEDGRVRAEIKNNILSSTPSRY